MSANSKHLVILGCSSRKLDTSGEIPAIQRYDGPAYQILRSYLRASDWPTDLSVGILSARFGLIGGLTPIPSYDLRMNPTLAAKLAPTCSKTLTSWAAAHSSVSLVLGRDYLSALPPDRIASVAPKTTVVEGPIGIKLSHLSRLLRAFEVAPRVSPPARGPRPLYFLPDWDDLLDVEFDFRNDTFSAPRRVDRADEHCVKVMAPERICDGILVSLAQHVGTKGIMRRCNATDVAALAPRRIRERFGLGPDQWVFGDCGAFSYAAEDRPSITTEQAVSLYDAHGFDFGASVDHIPLLQVPSGNGTRLLSEGERQERVALTRANAADFISQHKGRRCRYVPVGIIQSLSVEGYGSQVLEYSEMGYTHVALGGLVPKSDSEVLAVAEAVHAANCRIRRPLWIHLFGVFRPKIQTQLRACGVNSFDSAPRRLLRLQPRKISVSIPIVRQMGHSH